MCEGWTEHIFQYTPGVSDDRVEHEPLIPIKLHLEFDDFRGDLMLKSKSDGRVYEVGRMLPPGTHRYFYTY